MKNIALDKTEELELLKETSKIKHEILQEYLGLWARVLGSSTWSDKICYFDCYAGPGSYQHKGAKVPGSPIIAVNVAKRYLTHYNTKNKKKFLLWFMENDSKQINALEKELSVIEKPDNLILEVTKKDSQQVVEKIMKEVSKLAPSFFMVDPYWHPLTIPTLNEILSHSSTEVLVNFMYYQINRDISNKQSEKKLDSLFGGDKSWRAIQNEASPKERERKLVEFFIEKVTSAKFSRRFCVRFGDDDNRLKGRSKYYLIHFSNHQKAVNLMKDVMHKLSDTEGASSYSGDRNYVLPLAPAEGNVKNYFMKKFHGTGEKITFNDLVNKVDKDNPNEILLEKTYRKVLQKMRKEKLITIEAISSKTTRGLKEDDVICFNQSHDEPAK